MVGNQKFCTMKNSKREILRYLLFKDLMEREVSVEAFL